MNVEEFLKAKDNNAEVTSEEMPIPGDEVPAESLDVQKAVVESLAEEKIVIEEKLKECQGVIADLRKENYRLQKELAVLAEKVSIQNEALGKVGDILSKNVDGGESAKVSLLECDPELPNRFPGESRDHVLEVVAEARIQAEREGRLRRAQVLESVLLANEPSGELKKRRLALEKLFSENANILSGNVMSELDRMGIAYRKGEDFLLPKEILQRVY